MTLNKMTKAIMKEHGCCRRHANRLAHKIMDEINTLNQTEKAYTDRQQFMEKRGLIVEWHDYMSENVAFDEVGFSRKRSISCKTKVKKDIELEGVGRKVRGGLTVKQWKNAHQRYLASKEWAQLKKRLFKKYGEYCRSCGSTQQLQVHHLTYDRWRQEELTDLVVLCCHCHATIHGKI